MSVAGSLQCCSPASALRGLDLYRPAQGMRDCWIVVVFCVGVEPGDVGIFLPCK